MEDFSVADNLNSIKDYWDKLIAIGAKYGYFPKPTKSYLIVREKNQWKDKTYLLIQEWNHSSRKNTPWCSYWEFSILWRICERLSETMGQPTNGLSTIAETQPQAAYLAFASGFKSKLNYFLRSIPNICHLLLPLKRTIWNNFIPIVTGCHICNGKERVLISLPIRYSWLAIPIFHETVEIEQNQIWTYSMQWNQR